MAKATVNQTPTQELLKAAQAETTVVDSLGRVFTLRKPGALGQFRLVEALGDAARNQVYMGMCLPLIYISTIDGDLVKPPTTKLQVEALIQRLEEEGIEAVANAVAEHYGKQDPEAAAEALKN